MQLSSAEEKSQKLEMDRDQLRLKHKQQLSIQSESEEKVKSLEDERDKFKTQLKETEDMSTSTVAKLQNEHLSEVEKLKSQLGDISKQL